jgi:hypothetical protein
MFRFLTKQINSFLTHFVCKVKKLQNHPAIGAGQDQKNIK